MRLGAAERLSMNQLAAAVGVVAAAQQSDRNASHALDRCGGSSDGGARNQRAGKKGVQ
jgi:hypothetical protein